MLCWRYGDVFSNLRECGVKSYRARQGDSGDGSVESAIESIWMMGINGRKLCLINGGFLFLDQFLNGDRLDFFLTAQKWLYLVRAKS